MREVPKQLDKLIDALRSTDGLTTRGATQSTFYIGTKPFLHFHDGPGGLEADVKWDHAFVREPVETHAQRVALIERVRAHLAAR